AHAQRPTLPDRLDAAARATLERTIDTARVAGLPVGPLYDKVSEGVLKGAADDQIVRAVRSLARSLGDARRAAAAGAPIERRSERLDAGNGARDVGRPRDEACPRRDGNELDPEPARPPRDGSAIHVTARRR